MGLDVLVLGARGGLGKLVCAELAARGHRTKTVTRAELRDPEALARAVTGGGHVIINCAGASVALGLGHGWRGYRAVDTPIGLAAVEAARRTGARLVYVGVCHAPALARGAYIDAHERVAAAMRDIDGVVVRPTGFFSAYAALLPIARRGLLVDIGDGRARTNPIDERDLAAIVADQIAGGGPRELDVGGPEIVTRGQIFEEVAARAGRRVRILRMPAWLAGGSGAVLRVLHPRMGQFARFAAGLARHDVVAPAAGTRTLASYLDALALAPGAPGAPAT
ncbi:MAG TPA: NAD-dependent epimerase/dehydratase family protein [Kofleriaceae bacterium]|nr:NAD-dependent epimerase/dehydratase family protein [Kofleriaceae bacterium]